ncbi:hypothetical protein [Streptomyces sp. NPDC003710]
MKLLHPDFASDASYRARFVREVAVLRKVSGPYLVPLTELCSRARGDAQGRHPRDADSRNGRLPPPMLTQQTIPITEERMNFRTAAIVATAVGTLALAGCASSNDPDVVEQATGGPAKTASSSSTKPTGQLVASGFGQQDECVWVTSLVRNTSPHVGQTVTVQFNILDAHNKIIGSGSQVESFSQPDQLLVVGTQVDVKSNEKAAKVKATLLVEDEGTFSTKPLPKIPTSAVHIGKGEYGDTTGTFEVSNPTTAPLKDARVGVICYDTKHNVVGGSSEYPDLVPPSGKIRIESTLNTLGAPATCDAYAGPGL